MKKYLSIVFILIFIQFSYTQSTKNLKLKNYRIAYLSDSLQETSGLVFLDKKLYTFNDGGNPSLIFEIKLINGEILKTYNTIIVNKDWEAITSNNKSLFLADFGNNFGTRKDLKIHQLEVIDSKINLQQTFPFEYENQLEFTEKPLKNDFDCESMIFDDNKLHLFTKEWKSKSTSHYILDINTTSKQKLKPVETFETNFLVTDAAYHNEILYLIGYTKTGKCYLQSFKKSNSGLFFKNRAQKFKLGSALTIGQIEGITVDENGIFISAEGFKKSIFNLKPTLYFIPFKDLY